MNGETPFFKILSEKTKILNPTEDGIESSLLYSRITKTSFYLKRLGMHQISGRPDNPAFFDIRYPAGYQIALPDIR
jgi:hypothetical protein